MAWSTEQRRNAATIASVGRSMGASNRDVLIGLMTAMQESGLRNVNYGDRDSLGLFQQRPSQGWGTSQQVRNPEYASRKFFSVLLADDSRNSRSLTAAAQAVQRSAYPDAYAKHESSMRDLMGNLGVDAPSEGGGGGGGQGRQGQSPGLPSVEPGRPSITPSQNLDAVLAQGQEGAMSAPGQVQGLTQTVSNQPDLSGTMPLRDGEPVDPDAEVEENPLEGLRLADEGEGALPAENPLETQYVTQNDEDFIDNSEFSTGTPWRGTDTETGFAPHEGGGGEFRSDFSGGGGGGAGVKAVALAAEFAGTPYKWGGKSPLGFDCSGLTTYVLGKAGIDIPHGSVNQAQGGRGVSMSELKPGDLLFWDASSRNGSGADHVAIYAGGGQMIEANGPRGRVVKTGVRSGAWARRYT